MIAEKFVAAESCKYDRQQEVDHPKPGKQNIKKSQRKI